MTPVNQLRSFITAAWDERDFRRTPPDDDDGPGGAA